MKTNDFILNRKIALAIFCVGVTAFAALNCLQPIIPAMGKSLGLQPAAGRQAWLSAVAFLSPLPCS